VEPGNESSLETGVLSTSCRGENATGGYRQRLLLKALRGTLGLELAEPQLKRQRRLADGRHWLSGLWVAVQGILTALVIGGGFTRDTAPFTSSSVRRRLNSSSSVGDCKTLSARV